MGKWFITLRNAVSIPLCLQSGRYVEKIIKSEYV